MPLFSFFVLVMHATFFYIKYRYSQRSIHWIELTRYEFNNPNPTNLIISLDIISSTNRIISYFLYMQQLEYVGQLSISYISTVNALDKAHVVFICKQIHTPNSKFSISVHIYTVHFFFSLLLVFLSFFFINLVNMHIKIMFKAWYRRYHLQHRIKSGCQFVIILSYRQMSLYISNQ